MLGRPMLGRPMLGRDVPMLGREVPMLGREVPMLGRPPAPPPPPMVDLAPAELVEMLNREDGCFDERPEDAVPMEPREFSEALETAASVVRLRDAMLLQVVYASLSLLLLTAVSLLSFGDQTAELCQTERDASLLRACVHCYSL